MNGRNEFHSSGTLISLSKAAKIFFTLRSCMLSSRVKNKPWSDDSNEGLLISLLNFYRVPTRKVRDFSKFGVCPSDKYCSSARCAYAAKKVVKDLDVFAIGAVSLNHIL
jgi:hypothetical protein